MPSVEVGASRGADHPGPDGAGRVLAGYSGRTREACALDLRTFHRWCAEREVELFAATRAHINLYARWLEGQGRARATVAQRLSTIVTFHRYAEEEHLIVASPAVHVRLAAPRSARRLP